MRPVHATSRTQPLIPGSPSLMSRRRTTRPASLRMMSDPRSRERSATAVSGSLSRSSVERGYDLVGRRGRAAVPLHQHPGREPRVESDQAPCARGAARVVSGDAHGVSAVAGRLPVSSSTVPTPHVGSGLLCAEVLHPEREAIAQDAQGHLLARLGQRVADDGAVLDPVIVGREPARGLELDLGKSGAVGRGHGWTHGGGEHESKAEGRSALLHAGWDASVTQMVRLRRSGVVDDQGARFVSVTLK